jgi:hypothetical protein
MFVRQVQNQFRNSKADVQIFYGTGKTSLSQQYSWIKPVGISQVYIMLIGGGGIGDAISFGGNSGNVTTWFGAAQNVPDDLLVTPASASASSGNNSTISYRGTTLTTLLTATGGNISGSANTADTAGFFANSGFYQNVLGQIGTGGNQTASSTTFLSGGTGGSVTANYGYTTPSTGSGYFLFQPIAIGVSSSAGTDLPYGCGQASPINTIGTPGLILIASW